MAHTKTLFITAVASLFIISSLPLAHSFRSQQDLQQQHHSHDSHVHVSSVAVGPLNELGLPPGIEPNCGCVQRERCGDSTLAYTNAVIRLKASSMVCGRAFQLCCIDDKENGVPWPGVIDNFHDIIPCVPVEDCSGVYGKSPTDVRDYGSVPPCPGLGAVRCLDGKVQIIHNEVVPQGPTHIVIPIVEQPAVVTPPIQTTIPLPPAPVPVAPAPPAPVPVVPVPTPTTSYGPPHEPEPVPVPPVPVPTASYGPPHEPEPVPVPPVPVPTTSYGPPPVVIPPEPVVVPETSYGPPSYHPPAVVPPEPVIVPTTHYGPPTPEPEPVVVPSSSYGPPSTDYGVPSVPSPPAIPPSPVLSSPYLVNNYNRFGTGFGGYARPASIYNYFRFNKRLGFSGGFGGGNPYVYNNYNYNPYRFNRF